MAASTLSAAAFCNTVSAEEMKHGEMLAQINQQSEMDHAQHNMEAAHVHHTHKTGDWMFEYRFMRMNQSGMLQGQKSVSPESLLFNPEYTDEEGNLRDNVPTDMIMDMHMVMAMYSFTDKMTWMVMANYLANEMDMIMQMPPGDSMGMDGGDMDMAEGMTEPMFMESSGLGDTQIAVMYKLDEYLLFNPLLTVMLNLPTGSIDETDANGNVLPYDMQLGSGSYDLQPSFTMSNTVRNWDFGYELSYLYRLCDNKENYNLGNKYRIQGWTRHRLGERAKVRFAINYNNWEKIQGRDERLNDNTDNYGGMRADFVAGISYDFAFGLTINGQYSIPFHQDLNGIQMETDNIVELAAQYMIM